MPHRPFTLQAPPIPVKKTSCTLPNDTVFMISIRTTTSNEADLSSRPWSSLKICILYSLEDSNSQGPQALCSDRAEHRDTASVPTALPERSADIPVGRANSNCTARSRSCQRRTGYPALLSFLRAPLRLLLPFCAILNLHAAIPLDPPRPLQSNSLPNAPQCSVS